MRVAFVALRHAASNAAPAADAAATRLELTELNHEEKRQRHAASKQ